MFLLKLGVRLNGNFFCEILILFRSTVQHPGTNEKARNILKFYEHSATVLLINKTRLPFCCPVLCNVLSYLTIIYSRKHFSLHSDLHDLHFMLFSIYHDTAFTTRYINRLFSASLRFFYHIIHKWAKMPSHFHHLYSFLH
jgi:hypothetical protein